MCKHKHLCWMELSIANSQPRAFNLSECGLSHFQRGGGGHIVAIVFYSPYRHCRRCCFPCANRGCQHYYSRCSRLGSRFSVVEIVAAAVVVSVVINGVVVVVVPRHGQMPAFWLL